LEKRHCERQRRAAIQEHRLDCFATLAMTQYVLIASLLLLAACHKDRPPAPTREQNAQLNDAENMLNAMGNEEGPEAHASGPSNSSD
jgi:hypothetical protein